MLAPLLLTNPKVFNTNIVYLNIIQTKLFTVKILAPLLLNTNIVYLKIIIQTSDRITVASYSSLWQRLRPKYALRFP